MYITVTYTDNFGAQQSLIFNPVCAVVNLMKSIKNKCGFAHSDITLDLSDETGLVKELEHHQNDYASKHLDPLATYILVEKQIVIPPVDEQEEESEGPQVQYVPLLDKDKVKESFPKYQAPHVANAPEKSSKKGTKSPVPNRSSARGKSKAKRSATKHK